MKHYLELFKFLETWNGNFLKMNPGFLEFSKTWELKYGENDLSFRLFKKKIENHNIKKTNF